MTSPIRKPSTEDGGRLVATEGGRLAGAPVRFAGRSLILPSTAAQVLSHPDSAARANSPEPQPAGAVAAAAAVAS